MNLILCILLSAVGFFVGAKILPGVYLPDFRSSLVVAVVIALLNATLGKILTVASLGILGWGVFSFILTAIMIKVAEILIAEFKTDGFVTKILLAIIVSFVTTIGWRLIG